MGGKIRDFFVKKMEEIEGTVIEIEYHSAERKYTLYELLRYNLLILKIQGLFIHRVRDRPSRIHLLYCMILFMVKLTLSTMNIYQCAANMGYFVNVTFISLSTVNISAIDTLYKTRIFNFAIIKVLFILFHIHSISYVPIFWWLSVSRHHGFHKTALTFELCEKTISRNVLNYNNQIKARHYAWSMFYMFFSLLILCAIFLHRSILTTVYLLNKNNTHKFYVICLNFSYPMIAADAMSILYFICSQILLATYQFNSFSRYIARLVDVKRKTKRSNQMVNIESIRQFYNKLNRHVFHMDSWLRYVLGIIFLIWIPAFCLLIYCIIMYSKYSYQLLLFFIQVLIFILIQLFFLTVCGILLSSKARSFIDYLYQINLNNAKSVHEIQKV